MFDKLKQRWKVNGLNLLLIITTFALGGSLCGYAGRKLLALTSLDKGAVWLILYIVLITILWPLAVLLVSIPLGQFSFFKNYLTKVFKRLRGKQGNGKKQKAIINVAIFASGAGSNAQKIIEYISLNGGNVKNEANQLYKIALIVCNKPEAGVLKIATQNNIPSILIKRDLFLNGDNYLPELKKNAIDFIVLAGFLWKIPEQLIKAYPKKIINIHPALLPKYGGKGMFGHYVHEAVVANKEAESGITIHFVDELYDHGEIIFQAKCAVDKSDTADTLASKIHALEHTHYPQVIINTIQKQNCS